jgi:hypothetical protein
VPNSQLSIGSDSGPSAGRRVRAAIAAPLPEGVSEQQRAKSPVHAARPARASVIVHASAEMDSEYFIAVGRAQANLSTVFPGTAGNHTPYVSFIGSINFIPILLRRERHARHDPLVVTPNPRLRL